MIRLQIRLNRRNRCVFIIHIIQPFYGGSCFLRNRVCRQGDYAQEGKEAALKLQGEGEVFHFQKN